MRLKLLLSFFAVLTIVTAKAQWTQVNNGLTANLSQGVKFICGHNGNMFTGTYTGFKLYRSSNYGDSWTEISTPVVSGIPVSTFSSGNRLFFGLNVAGNNLYYTDDLGATWQAASGGPQSSVVRGFYKMSNSLFCYTSNLGIYRSNDNGVSWVQINNGITILNAVKLESVGTRLLACTINGGVYYSDNLGDLWTQSNNGISSAHLAGAQLFRLGAELFYMDQSSASYKSSDQGNTWSAFTNPSFWGIRPRIVYRNEQSQILYMKNAFGLFGEIDSLYSSSDEGATWNNITGNLPQAFNEATFTEHNGLVFYAFDIQVPNQGIYRYGQFNGIEENKINTFSMYPNPASKQITIDYFNFNATNDYTLNIVNSLGKKIHTIPLNQQKLCIDLSTFTGTGIYFVQIIDSKNSAIESRKIVLQ
ncbi:MAG: T9SS type A sorting domain-containing protein [Bacteroidota bacterium]|jgi:photosystem II stability/assembly factor-like uncharacterized protein